MFVLIDESYLIGPINSGDTTAIFSELIRQDSQRAMVLVRQVSESQVTRDPENYNEPSPEVLTPGRFAVSGIVVEIVSV